MHGFSSSDRNVYRTYGREDFAKYGTNGRQFNHVDQNPHDPASAQGQAWLDGWREAWVESMGLTLASARAMFAPAR